MTLKPEVSNELRSMVREVLREVMATPSMPAAAGVEAVRIGSDAELAAFVARVLEPATAEAIRSGKLRFTLRASPVLATSNAPAPAAGQVLQGVITEQKIERLDGAGVLVLAAGAVLTPLARDKARRLGLKIERRR